MLDQLKQTLEARGQSHLLRYWDQLEDAGRNRLAAQIKGVDWDALSGLIQSHVLNAPETDIPEDLSPAPYFPAIPEDDERATYYRKAKAAGVELLSSGQVAALTVAGGQGTRLGFDGPKGTYPITPVEGKTLFQYFAESLLRAGEKFGHPIPWFIMTSEMNDQATREFFEERRYFGLDPTNVSFFTQGTMPAIGLDGKLLLAEKDSLALAPDGHGGTLLALRVSGALDAMRQAGVNVISYFQVDNPLVSVVDPLFIGLHHLEQSEMSARMLAKTNPHEKLGNFCVSGGRLRIIEYSDMPDELAEARDEAGRLRFISGSPAIHVINREFVERLTDEGRLNLPWHRADKKVSCVDGDGNIITPDEPNAVKLESFIFDALPMAEKPMVFEAIRDEEFAPTKNKTGVDSVESCREMLIDRDAKWLKAVGVAVPEKDDGRPDCVVELSPRHYLDVDDVAAAAKTGDLKRPERGERVYYQ